MHANDPIVDEIHRIRAEIMNEQDNDIPQRCIKFNPLVSGRALNRIKNLQHFIFCRFIRRHRQCQLSLGTDQTACSLDYSVPQSQDFGFQ